MDGLRVARTGAAIGALLLVLGAVAHGLAAPYWTDEILTARVVADPSFGHMLSAVADCISAAPPLYFIVAWAWARLFGAGELALRLLSGLFVAAAFLVLFAALRRRVDPALALAASCLALFTPEVLTASREARFYSLYLLFAALALRELLPAAAGEDLGRAALWRLAAWGSAAALTHAFWLPHAGVLLVVMAGLDARRARLRPALYIAIGACFPVFALVWGRPFLHQMRSYHPHSWIPVPGALDLLRTLAVAPQVWATLLGLLLVLVLLRRSRRVAGNDAALGLGLVLLPALLAFAVSRLGPSCFLARYLLPIALGWAVLLAAALAALAPGRRVAITLALLGLGLAAGIQVRDARGEATPAGPPGSNFDRILADLGVPREVPVVTTQFHTFHVFSWYANGRRPYVFLIDPDYPVASGPDRGFHEVVRRIMEAYRRQYPGPAIRDWQEFLDSTGRFAVLETTDHALANALGWVEFRRPALAGFEERVLIDGQGGAPRLTLFQRR